MPEPVVAFFDVDGTLTFRDPVTGPTNIPTRRVQDAVRRFVEKGNVAVVCTGRDLGGIRELLDCLPFAGAVTMDGTRVILHDKVIYSSTMPADVWATALSEIRRVGMETLVSGPDGCLIVSDNHGSDFCRLMSHLEFYEDYVARGGRLDFAKLDFYETSLAACRASEFLMFNFTYLNVGDGYHELVIPGNSKGRGHAAHRRAALYALALLCLWRLGERPVDPRCRRLRRGDGQRRRPREGTRGLRGRLRAKRRRGHGARGSGPDLAARPAAVGRPPRRRRPVTCRYLISSRIFSMRRSTSMGLEMCPSMPAARASSRSVEKAFAVTAMMGTLPGPRRAGGGWRAWPRSRSWWASGCP